ncbi:tryptophan halogenase family protein [Sphingomonas lenta]|uniref:Tryptophan halogenase n=1 Tax=Sphingomonas lenta TaxID=1141887 RepID=A0A2A2SBR5_9SPHN|nr:tryptophan halogenase family protein [Sphingomonas lenta]PAX06744.1 tryptophan halogenase [Sphingomonas lenta]
MSALGEPIRDVVVAGGGIVGWSAAAALKRRLPWLGVTVFALPPPPDALADRIGPTLPSIHGFHGDLGLRDADAVVRSGSAFRLGTRFENWVADSPDYVHAYGEHGRPFGTASFHQHWVRAAKLGAAAPFDRHSPAAMLARAGRFARAADEPDAPLSGFEYGLHLDPPAYLAMIRAFALHCGVREHDGVLRSIRLRPDGFVEALELDGGEPLRADLFVDCTGPAARVRSALDDAWEDWRRWLPCDRILIADGPPAPEPAPLDRAVAVEAGWRWSADGLRRTSTGLVYGSAHWSDEQAARALGVREAAPVAIAAGTRPQPWLRNCVAVGDAATAIEPLEWTNLHLAHSAIDRLVAMLPDRDCAPVELAEYNRQCAAEAARVRDFAVLYYAASGRSEPFWRDAAAAEPPPTLLHTLTQFRERGRLPFHEEETFGRDSWLAVLLGQGVIPRRADPLIEVVPPAQSDAAMAGWRDALAQAVARAPTHAAFLQMLHRQVTR